MLRRMLGEERAAEVRAAWASLSPDFSHFVTSFLAGQIWSRPNLDLRTRSLITVAALTALGRPNGLRLNIEMALTIGRRGVRGAGLLGLAHGIGGARDRVHFDDIVRDVGLGGRRSGFPDCGRRARTSHRGAAVGGVGGIEVHRRRARGAERGMEQGESGGGVDQRAIAHGAGDHACAASVAAIDIDTHAVAG